MDCIGTKLRVPRKSDRRAWDDLRRIIRERELAAALQHDKSLQRLRRQAAPIEDELRSLRACRQTRQTKGRIAELERRLEQLYSPIPTLPPK
jgi:predicted secreted Zn-dependent protease